MTGATNLSKAVLSSCFEVGLRQQGLLPRVEDLLNKGLDWTAIGKAIGWDGDTARDFYEYERPIQTLLARSEEDRDMTAEAVSRMGQLTVFDYPFNEDPEMKVAQGTWLDVCLPSLAVCGYLWDCAVELTGEEQGALRIKAPEQVMQRGEKEGVNIVVGKHGIERFGFHALGVGTVQLIFTQRRPFEPTTNPAQGSACVRVTVI